MQQNKKVNISVLSRARHNTTKYVLRNLSITKIDYSIWEQKVLSNAQNEEKQQKSLD